MSIGRVPGATGIQPSVFTTTGDLLYASAASSPARLGIGSTDQVLKVSGGIPAWGAAPVSFKGALVYMANGVTQSLSNSTYTAINFATEQFDTDAFHSTVTNTNRLTIPTGLGGYYQIYGNLRFDTNGTGVRRLDFEVNGSGNTYGVSIFTPNATTTSSVASTITLNLVAGDWVGISALQTSGGNLNVQGNSAIAGSFFGITYLGA